MSINLLFNWLQNMVKDTLKNTYTSANILPGVEVSRININFSFGNNNLDKK